jgi:hypothetical protein
VKDIKIKIALSLATIPGVIIIGCFIAGGLDWLTMSGFNGIFSRIVAVFVIIFVIPFVWMADFKEVK